jgi:hypothetical protein
VAFANQKIEDEIVDMDGFLAITLEQIEVRSARFIESYNFSIDHGAFGKIAKGFDKIRILMVERFVPPRKQIHTDVRFERDSAIAVEFNFIEPSRPVDQLWDGSAVHWFDEVSFSYWQRT